MSTIHISSDKVKKLVKDNPVVEALFKSVEVDAEIEKIPLSQIKETIQALFNLCDKFYVSEMLNRE